MPVFFEAWESGYDFSDTSSFYSVSGYESSSSLWNCEIMYLERRVSLIYSILLVSSYWKAFFMPPVSPDSPASSKGTIALMSSSFSRSGLSLSARICLATCSLSTNYSSISYSSCFSRSYCLAVNHSLICVIFYSSMSKFSVICRFWAILIACSFDSISLRKRFSSSSGIKERSRTIYSSIWFSLYFAPSVVRNVKSFSSTYFYCF